MFPGKYPLVVYTTEQKITYIFNITRFQHENNFAAIEKKEAINLKTHNPVQDSGSESDEEPALFCITNIVNCRPLRGKPICSSYISRIAEADSYPNGIH